MGNYKLCFWQRLLLYLVTIIFAVLAIIDVVLKEFHTVIGITIYVCAAFTLTVSCYYFIINIRHSVSNIIFPGIDVNPFAHRIRKDYYYRTITFAIAGLILSVLFAVFNGIIGLLSLSPWFGTLAAYYLLLSIMRTAILQHQKKVLQSGDKEGLAYREVCLYKSCGVMMLMLLFVLIGAVVLLLTFEGGKSYPGVTIYAVAAYAFYKITLSIINLVKTRKMQTVVLRIIRDIGFVDSCVAILSLQTAMFSAFGGDSFMILIFNGATGIAVCCAVFTTAFYELRFASRKKKELLLNGARNQN